MKLLKKNLVTNIINLTKKSWSVKIRIFFYVFDKVCEYKLQILEFEADTSVREAILGQMYRIEIHNIFLRWIAKQIIQTTS